MADRLRLSLSSYFSKHIERGDWCRCLKALHGCVETGTLLHSLPFSTLFPFLVENGQWESVLRLSSQLMAVEETFTTTSSSSSSCSSSGGGGGGGANASSDEGALYNTLLRVAMAPEATKSMGSWQAAAALVQRVARRRVRLETPVIRDVLGAVEKWRWENISRGGGSGSGSGSGSSSSTMNSKSGTSVVDEGEARRKALQLARDILAADLHLRGESSAFRPVPVHRKPLRLQSDLVRVVGVVLQASMNEGGNNAAAAPWTRLQEQLRASFASSWEDAVHTVLRICAAQFTPVHEEEEEVVVVAAATAGEVDGRELCELLLDVSNRVSEQPDVAERVLRLTQECLFESGIISCSSKVVLGDAHDLSNLRCRATSLTLWQRAVKRNTAVELLKWEAVRALTMAELQQREKQQQQHLKSRFIEMGGAVLSVERLCIAAQLVFLRGAAVEEMCDLSELDDDELNCVENTVRKLLLHGAALSLSDDADGVLNLLVNTIQSLMAIYVRCCRARDHRRAAALGAVAVTHEGSHRSSNNMHDRKSNRRSRGRRRGNTNDNASLEAPSVLELRRQAFWGHVLFPGDSLVAWRNSWQQQQQQQQEERVKTLRFLSGWQLLLRRVFRDAWVLTMWFLDNPTEGRASTAADEGGLGAASDMGRDRVGHHGQRSSPSATPPHFFPRRRRRRVDDVMRQLQQLVCFLSQRFTPSDGGGVTVSALSELLTRQVDVDSLGQALLRGCESNGASVAEAAGIWRTFVASIATHHAVPLLQRMMEIDTLTESNRRRLKPSLTAIVAVLHGSSAFSATQKEKYTEALLHSVEPCTRSWSVALALFAEAVEAICKEQPQHNDREKSSLGHIMNALVVRATPPRWQEALQVVEIMRELAPSAAVTTTTTSSSSSSNISSSLSSSSSSSGGGCGFASEKTPLSEGERIDMYELVLPMKQRRHWMSAMTLFEAYEKRRLSGRDAACFAFAIASGPVMFAQRVLRALGDHEKSEAVAEAALLACSRNVSHAILIQRKKRRGSDAAAQARAFLLHEASEVARLALAAWPTPITDVSRFAFVWEKVKLVCAGDVEAARLLLRQSAFYDSEQARSEATALTHTVRLCHTAQDAASAIDAYRTFRSQFIAMALPETTMLLLLELCVAAVEERCDGTRRDISILCTVLQDALWMHDSTAYSGKGQETAKVSSFFLRTCTVVFGLSRHCSDLGANETVTNIPKLRCEMVPGLQPHISLVVRVLVRHLRGSDARLLRNLADLIGVLRALPPSRRRTAATQPEQILSRDSSLRSLIEVLWSHMQQLRQQLGPVVPEECVFWLDVLRRVEKWPLARNEDEAAGVSHWVPAAFVTANDARRRSDAEMHLDYVVTRALEAASVQDEDRLLPHSVSSRCQLLPSSIDAIAFALQHGWHTRPPLTVILAALNMALQLLRDVSVWTSDSAASSAVASSLSSSLAVTNALVSFQSILSCFHLRHAVDVLTVAAHPSDSLSSAVDGALSRTAYEAVGHTRKYVSLLLAWVQVLVRRADDRGLVDEDAEKEKKLWGRQLHRMVQLIAMAMGTCMAWADSSLRDACLRDLQRSCEVLQRCVHVCYAGFLSYGSQLLLRVMNGVLQGDVLDDEAAERLFGDSCVASDDVSVVDDNSNDNSNDGGDDLSSVVMAVALLQVVRQGAVPHIHLMRSFLASMCLGEDLRRLLQNNDLTLMRGLVALQLACYGDAASVRHMFGTSIPLVAQFIARVVELDALLSPVGLSVAFVSSVMQPIWLGKHLVEIAVLATLAACHHSEPFHATHKEKDILAMMDAVSAVVPHQWGLIHAITLGCPLQKQQQPQLQEMSSDVVLRERLVFALQCCGSWPRGTALPLLLRAYNCEDDDGAKNTGGSTLPDYPRLVEAMTDLDVSCKWRTKMLPLQTRKSCYTSSLLLYVALQHRQANTAASIMLGNLLKLLRQRGSGASSAVQKRQRVLNTLFSSNSVVQLLALACVTSPLERRGSVKRQQQHLLAEITPWLSCSSSMQWWNAVSADVKHLILSTRIPFTLCGVAADAKTIAAAEAAAAAATTTTTTTTTTNGAEQEKKKQQQRRRGEEEEEAEAEALAGAALLVASSPAVSCSSSKRKTRADGDVSFVLSYPHALFNTAWVGELHNRRFKPPNGSTPLHVCRALRVPSTCHTAAGMDATEDESLFSTPAGYSSLQYVYALTTATAVVAAAVRCERSLLLSLACSESMHEVAVLLNARLAKRTCTTPVTVEVLLAAWNTVLIRRIELGSDGIEARQGLRGGAQLKEAPLAEDVAAAFLALAVTTLEETVRGGSCITTTTTTTTTSSLLSREQQRQLLAEMLLHAAASTKLFGVHATMASVDDERFRCECKSLCTSALSLLQRDPGASRLLDGHVTPAIELLKRYAVGEVAWVSLWPPLPLEMIRCRHYTKSLLQEQPRSSTFCLLRHPVAVWWMVQQCTALASRIVLPNRRLMMILFNILRVYVTTGVACFTIARAASEGSLDTAAPPMFVHGSGAGLVVDQFISLLLRRRRRRPPPPPLTSRGGSSSSGNDNNDDTNGEWDRDIIRLVVDALLPRESRDKSSSSSPSFLLGYAPLCSDGLQALARLVVLRDALDKRRTATVDHVIKLLRIEQRYEAARRVAARDAERPLLRVHIGHLRRPCDIQMQLLFFLRAFDATLRFVNPLCWHGERQATLDRAYTALLEFLQLHHESHGNVDIMSPAVEEELDRIFGPGARRVIHVATVVAHSECNVGVVTVLQLLRFFSGEWTSREQQHKSRVESDLHRQLHEVSSMLRGSSHAPEILRANGDNEALAASSSFSAFPKVVTAVQEALWGAAVTPSPALMLELLDAAAAAATDDHAARRCALQIFATIAPYTVVSTLMLEKVLVLLLLLSPCSLERGALKGTKALVNMTLDLVLRRFQYIPLNTPTAVGMLCELYAASTTATTSALAIGVGACGEKEEEEEETLNSAMERVVKTSPSHQDPFFSTNTTTTTTTGAQQQQLQELLLWRCAVEASGVACAPLEAALSHLGSASLQALQRGCLAFLVQGHTRPHYDPPFLRLGRLLDTLIIRDGANDVSFAQQLLRAMEMGNVTHTSGALGVLPWRRVMQFLPEPHYDGVNHGLLMPPDVVRLRFLVAFLMQRISATGNKIDGVRQLWQQALATILPALCTSSAEEGKSDYAAFCCQAAAVALRTIHVVEPQQQWKPALQLTMRLAAEASSSSPSSLEMTVSATYSSCGRWWLWSSPEAVLFHTLRYLVEACDVTMIPLTSLLPYLSFVAARQTAAAPLKNFTGQLNRVRVVMTLTQQLQRHPYLRWVDALDVLNSLNKMEKMMEDTRQGTGASSSSISSRLCPQEGLKDDEERKRWEAPLVLLQKAKGDFFTAVMSRLYKKQLYEPLLRFAEAAQQHHRQRVYGRQALVWLNHAASVVVAPKRGSGGPWEILMLLNGTLLGKTLDDILREQSVALLQERACLLRDLLRNGRCGDAAALARQSPALLHTREFHGACAGLMDRFRHNAIVLFYDELIRRETEEEEPLPSEEDPRGSSGSSSSSTPAAPDMMDRVEVLSCLQDLPADVLRQALEAFEMAANSTKGISRGSVQTGLWITAACLGQSTALLQSKESLAATLRWIQRDVAKTEVGLLRIIANAVDKALCGENLSNENEGTRNSVTLLQVLQNDHALARLLVEFLSGTFPAIAERLCESLLQQQQQQQHPIAHVADADAWLEFLRSTATYNAALQRAKEQCCMLLETSTKNSGRDAIVQWRDRSLFCSSSSSSNSGNAWLSALAVYGTARSVVGYAAHSGAHVALLVKLIASSGKPSVVIGVARDVFYHTAFQHKGGGVDGAFPFMEMMVLLGNTMWEMKRQLMQCITSSTEVELSERQQQQQQQQQHQQQLLSTLGFLQELNQFVADGLVRLREKQRGDHRHHGELLDGHVELACRLLGSITVTPIVTAFSVVGASMSETPLHKWRSIAHDIIGALSPPQRDDDAVLNALMESVRDSFEVLRLVRQHPVPAVTSCQELCRGLWCSALQLITVDSNLGRRLFARSTKQTVAMVHLETLLYCASLVRSDGNSDTDAAVIAAMKSLCDLALRGCAVPLTEDAKAVLKIACIHHKGAAWRPLYEEVTGFAPTLAQRQTALSPSEETLQQDLCTVALDAVCDWAQALRIGQEKRDAGVRLRHVHYRRLLHLLEQHIAENESAAAATRVGDAVIALHFARMQDGSAPNVQAMEQSLRLLSHSALSPLCALQYAQAMTLLPPTNNRRHTGPDTGSPSSCSSEDMCLSLSATSVHLVTDATLRLLDAVREKYLTVEEGLEGLRMFASFVRWAGDFRRLPCFERGIMESITLLLCTMPEQLFQRQQQHVADPHDVSGLFRFASGDVRELLRVSLVTRHSGGTAPDGVNATAMSLDVYRFVRGASGTGGDSVGGATPTPVELLALRTGAAAALRIVQRQASLHRVLRLSDALLCRLFAALTAGVDLTAELLQPLSRIVQDTELISPSLRYFLALTVTEQSVLWSFVHGRRDSDNKSHVSVATQEVATSVVVRSLARVYGVVQQQFAPPDALVLRSLLNPKSPHESADSEDDNDDYGDSVSDGVVGVSWGEMLQEQADKFSADVWEQSLKLLHVLLRNAQPQADLSLPFAALIELLSRSGQWGLACRYVTLVGIPSMDAANAKRDLLRNDDDDDDDALRLLPKHVVLDGFLLWRLVDAGEVARRQQQYVSGQHIRCNMRPEFWRVALHFLQQQQHQFVHSTLVCGRKNEAVGAVATGDSVFSPALLAVMKAICRCRMQ